MCIGNWVGRSNWNEQICGTNIPREVEGLDCVNWQLTNSLKFNHRQKFRIHMRSDRWHLEKCQGDSHYREMTEKRSKIEKNCPRGIRVRLNCINAISIFVKLNDYVPWKFYPFQIYGKQIRKLTVKDLYGRQQ